MAWRERPTNFNFFGPGVHAVNSDISHLRFFDSLAERNRTAIVVTIAEDNQDSRCGFAILLSDEFVAGNIDCIEERRASTVAQSHHSRGQLLRIITVVLGYIRLACETQHKGSIQVSTHDLTEELNRGFLLEVKVPVYRITGVH